MTVSVPRMPHAPSLVLVTTAHQLLHDKTTQTDAMSDTACDSL